MMEPERSVMLPYSRRIVQTVTYYPALCADRHVSPQDMYQTGKEQEVQQQGGLPQNPGCVSRKCHCCCTTESLPCLCTSNMVTGSVSPMK